ncbi:hypothetical protein SEA_UGENIE5_38 [Mycobacterium phage Ugenie5]|nr:hypothetical protein SEA_SCHERZO_41 [Mycobacterium phage Scherzo]QBI96358.1 hypothetical protein SEA_UGENIE5_38 [Mycobacterium phage Ugenie5]
MSENSTAEPVLVVWGDYSVTHNGRRLGHLASMPRIEVVPEYWVYPEIHSQRCRISFEVIEYRDPPPAPRKRRSILDLGLRRPTK